MDSSAIRAKFGDDYATTERTFRLGIDIRLTRRIAERYKARTVVETCTGAGFTTIALAEVAKHVVTVEIDPAHQALAQANVKRARLLRKVTFIQGDALSEEVLCQVRASDAAFLDPDWAVTGPNHICRFRRSNMLPPADTLLEKVLARTEHVALVLPPFIDLAETEHPADHELQRLYLGKGHALYCLYFGALAETHGHTELHA